VLAVAVLLLAVAVLVVLRLHASRRKLHLLNQELQQSQDELRGANAGLQREVLELRSAGQEGAARLAQAERRARQYCDYLGQMGHELRTPLNGVLYFAHVLQRDRPLSERQQRGLRTIEESGQNLLALVNDIVDWARLDASKLELAPMDVGITAFLHQLSNTVRAKAEPKGLLFSVRAGAGLPVAVRLDETRLRQVLLNLLSNAIQFTERGQVTLEVQPLPPAAPPGAANPAPPGDANPLPPRDAQPLVRLRFEVRDSGPGMNESQRAGLFEPFGRSGAAKERPDDAGLGLVISRQLVRLMGGDIEVSSQPGQGSVFRFELDAPLAGAPAAEPMARGDSRRTLEDADSSAPAERVDVEESAGHVPPPSEELIILRELARIGNMRTIRERADYLKGLDPRYQPFAEQLAKLAEQCQSKAIANLVESYSTDRGTH